MTSEPHRPTATLQRNRAAALLQQCQVLRHPELRGKAFEDVCHYLLRHGRYRQRFRAVQTWAQWAEAHGHPTADHGIDLVGIGVDGTVHPIQVKFRGRGRRFTYARFPVQRFRNYNNLRTFVDCCQRYGFRRALLVCNDTAQFDRRLRAALERSGLTLHRMYGPALTADLDATPMPATVAEVSQALGLPPVADRIRPPSSEAKSAKMVAGGESTGDSAAPSPMWQRTESWLEAILRWLFVR